MDLQRQSARANVLHSDPFPARGVGRSILESAGSQRLPGPNRFIINYADTSDGQGGTGQFVTLTSVGPVVSYVEWSAAMNVGAFDADTDGDGLANGLEWILGGNPSRPDVGNRITSTGSASTGLTLSFTRNTAAVGSTTLAVEWTTDPAVGWPHSVAINGANGVNVNVSGNQVDVVIPAANAVDGKLFARLKATSP